MASAAEVGALLEVLGRAHREHHVEQHALRDELLGALVGAAGRDDRGEDRAHAGAAARRDPVVVAGGEAVHHHHQQVAVAQQLGVGEPEPGPVVVVVGVERAVGEHRLERLPDPVAGALEHLEEQLQLGAEDPDDVRLGDACLLGHRVGAGAGVPAPGEGAGRRVQHQLAAVVGAHPGAFGAALRLWSGSRLTCYQLITNVVTQVIIQCLLQELQDVHHPRRPGRAPAPRSPPGTAPPRAAPAGCRSGWPSSPPRCRCSWPPSTTS